MTNGHSNSSVPVLIVGAGPVGLGLAVDLGLRGVECILAEKRDGVISVPKMSQVSARNMEFCRRWGIAEEVRQAVWSSAYPLDFVYLTSLTGRELARLKVPPGAERGGLAYTPEGPSPCPQIYFDPIIVARAKSLPEVDLRYNTGLVSFTQDADAVHATLRNSLTGEEETLSAQYLVGCDGPGGAVREALGIGLGGLGVVANSINVFFRAPELSSLHDKGWARFYRLIDEHGCWGELIPIDGDELWRLTVFHETFEGFDPDVFLRRTAGIAFSYELISVLPWERSDFVAERYGAGRVFIAGDAAHQCSPTGGLGMHTGLGESVNLSWKLAAVLEGWAGPDLLSSYETECRPIAERNVGFATQAYRAITGLPGEAEMVDFLPSTTGDAAGVDQRLRNLSVAEHIKAQYCYEESPICLSDGTPPPDEDQKEYKPSARPGTRAPHAWLGEGKSIIDLFGGGFVLLRFGPQPPEADGIVDAAEARGVPLRVEDITDPAVAEIYERALVLVRPDGHIAWRGDTSPADPLALIDRVRGA